MYFSAPFSAIKMCYHSPAGAIVGTCMNAHRHTHIADSTQPQQAAPADSNHSRQQVNVPALRGRVYRERQGRERDKSGKRD